MTEARGATLIEAIAAMAILAVLAGLAAPRSVIASEQARVDRAAAVLSSLLLAERLIYLERGAFSGNLQELVDLGLVEAEVLEQDRPFLYLVKVSDARHFQAEAVRQGSDVWSGRLYGDESGRIQGWIESGHGHRIHPPQL